MTINQLYTALRLDMQRYHVRAQLLRFVVGVAATLTVDFGTEGSAWPAKTLVTAGVSAAWLTLRQMFPTMPWSTVVANLEELHTTPPKDGP